MARSRIGLFVIVFGVAQLCGLSQGLYRCGTDFKEILSCRKWHVAEWFVPHRGAAEKGREIVSSRATSSLSPKVVLYNPQLRQPVIWTVPRDAIDSRSRDANRLPEFLKETLEEFDGALRAEGFSGGREFLYSAQTVADIFDFLRYRSMLIGRSGYSLGRTNFLEILPTTNKVLNMYYAWSEFFDLETWDKAYYRFFGDLRLRTDEFLARITAEGNPVVFFMPPDIFSYGIRRAVDRELVWFLHHSDRMRDVHIVFGAYEVFFSYAVNPPWPAAGGISALRVQRDRIAARALMNSLSGRAAVTPSWEEACGAAGHCNPQTAGRPGVLLLDFRTQVLDRAI